MNQSLKSVFTEVACIVILATVIGLAWNHKMLYRAWTGTTATTPATRVSAQAAPAASTPAATLPVPLPVGLMQVKDFSDRKEAVVVDARDAATFEKGHIKGAVSLPIGETDKRQAEFMTKHPLTSMLIIYCNGYSCHDSMELGKKLISAGYRDVYVFEGGYPEWRDAGYPVEGSAP